MGIHNNNTSSVSPEGNSYLPPGQNNFSVPEEYFDFLPEKIMARIQVESKQKQSFFLLKPLIAIPSFTFLFVLTFFLIHLMNKSDASDGIMLSENEIQGIVDNPDLYDIDDSVITEQYLSSDVSYTSLNEEQNFTNEEINSYLEEDTNAENIINEY